MRTEAKNVYIIYCRNLVFNMGMNHGYYEYKIKLGRHTNEFYETFLWRDEER
jgi:hypothetical protein